jgi:hypothetical protein
MINDPGKQPVNINPPVFSFSKGFASGLVARPDEKTALTFVDCVRFLVAQPDGKPVSTFPGCAR